jgi:uncharacterized membrane protein required for colicin V production
VLDSAYIIILVFFGVKGFWAGDSREILGLLTVGLSLLLAMIPSAQMSLDLQHAGLTPDFATPTAFAVSAAVIFPISYVSISVLGKEINYFGSQIPILKRCLGAAFSALKALILIILFSNLLLRLPVESQVIKNSHLVPKFSFGDYSRGENP